MPWTTSLTFVMKHIYNSLNVSYLLGSTFHPLGINPARDSLATFS